MLNTGIKDFVASMARLPLALYFAWSDTKARYRRSTLGPLWLVVGTGISVAGLGLLWSILLNQDKSTLIPALTIGLVTWQFISGSIVDSTSAFVRNAAVIKNIETPFFIFSLQLLLRHIVNFSHNCIVILIVLAIFPPPLGMAQLLLVPGLLLVILNLFWIVTFIGIVGTRFRDMEPIVSSLMPLMFFLSPVLYKPDHLGVMKSIAWVNPFAYFIALIRDPIQGVVPQGFVYLVSSVMLVVGWIATLALLSSKNKRISLWI